jgi:thiosulfate/3-mercaptopyruvate sulfurtransferase
MRLKPLLAAALVIFAAGRLPAAAPAGGAAPSVVSTTWLAERLGKEGGVVTIDARPSLKAYLAGHLPGAESLFADNVRSTAGGVPAALFPTETLQLIVHRLGLGPRRPVVVYSEESDVDATYVASVLRMSGIVETAVLDGGFKKWQAEKRPVTTERNPVAFSMDGLVPDTRSLVGIEEVKKAVEGKSAVLLDVRPSEQYAAGHLPGAKNRFWAKDVIPAGQPDSGSFRPEAEIAAELEALGVTKDKPVIVYCNTGHQASDGFYTLKYRLGYPNVRLYNGSWLEWSMTPGTPKETSAVPGAPRSMN